MRRRWRGGLRCLALLTVVAMAAACRPLYLPPVPAPLERPERMTVGVEPLLREGRPAVRVRLERIPREGWLALQWFSPGNREMASESARVEPGDAGATVSFQLPDDVPASAGRWRAVVSFEGEILRQVEVEVEAPERQ